MDNIYPDTIIQHKLHPSERAIIKQLEKKADNVCRNSISPTYIHTAFNNFKRGYYYTNTENEVIGFCLWKEHNNIQKDGTYLRKIHITLICADYNDYNLGRKILFDIDTYCIDNNFTFITLEAANDKLITYYEKGDFTLIDKEHRLMKKEIKIIRINRKNGKTRKIKRTPIKYDLLEELDI